MIALVLSGFIVFGKDFILLWAGPEYKEAYFIAIVTLIPLSIPLIQNTGLSIVTAQNKHQFRSIVYLIIAIVNVVSTYIVVPFLGGLGAALCSAISYVMGQGIIMNVYYYKITRINIPLFWKNIFRMSVIPIIMIMVSLFISQFFPFNSWSKLIIAVVIYILIYSAGMYKFSMNTYERDVIRQPVLRVLNKLKR